MKKEKVEEAFKEYRNKLYSFVYMMLKDRDRSLDIVHETFMKLYKEKKEIYNLRGWLFRVAKNLIIDYIRKNKRIIIMEKEWEIEDKYNTEKRNRLISLIEREIDKLPKIYKNVFILRDVEGYTYQEISKKLKLPIGTVKTRAYRARIFLREKLKDELRKI